MKYWNIQFKLAVKAVLSKLTNLNSGKFSSIQYYQNNISIFALRFITLYFSIMFDFRNNREISTGETCWRAMGLRRSRVEQLKMFSRSCGKTRCRYPRIAWTFFFVLLSFDFFLAAAGTLKFKSGSGYVSVGTLSIWLFKSHSNPYFGTLQECIIFLWFIIY